MVPKPYIVPAGHDTKFGALRNSGMKLPDDAEQCHTKQKKPAITRA